MRAVGAPFVPEGGSRLPDEQHLRFLGHMAELHATLWGWHDQIGLMPPVDAASGLCYRDRINSKSPRTVRPRLLFSEADEAVLDALGDRTRRLILQQLRDGPKPVVDIARGLPVSRPAVSQHLKVLKDAGLVVARADGTRRIYAVDPAALTALRTVLEGFWTEALARFREVAEGSDRQ